MAAHAPDTEADAIEAELDRLAGGRGALLGALGGVVADAVAYVLDGAASLDEL